MLSVLVWLFIYLLFGCTRSSLLLSLVVASNGGFSCGTQLKGFSGCGTWAHSLWLTGLVALWHAGSSQTKDRTHVPCIAGWTLNHWATREALV